MKRIVVMTAVVLGLAAGSAWANSMHTCQGNADCSTTTNVTNQGGQGGAGGTGIGVGIGIGGSQSQGQSQQQGQAQGQVQGQQQGQNNAQTISPTQSTKINVDAPLIPGVAVAPGLTSGGSQVCLGSFSVGLSGPMAGVAFGKTVIDKGCERRQNAVLLYNMGYKAEALELLKGDESVKALFVAPVAKTAAVEAPASPAPATARVTEAQGN